MTGIQTVAEFYIRLVYLAAIIAGLAGLGLYDMKKRRVPNRVLAVFLPIALLAVVCAPQGENLLQSTLLSLGGFAMGGGILLVVALKAGGIGGGDIKLCALLGLITGPFWILFVLLIATLLAMAAGVIVRLTLRERPTDIAFVPFLAIGFMGFYLFNIF